MYSAYLPPRRCLRQLKPLAEYRGFGLSHLRLKLQATSSAILESQDTRIPTLGLGFVISVRQHWVQSYKVDLLGGKQRLEFVEVTPEIAYVFRISLLTPRVVRIYSIGLRSIRTMVSQLPMTLVATLIASFPRESALICWLAVE